MSSVRLRLASFPRSTRVTSNAPNSGTVFVALEPFAARAKDPRKSGPAIRAALLQKLSPIQEGLVLVITPPPVRGIGTAGGFRMMVEDRAGRGPEALRAAVSAMMGRAAQTPGLSQVFSLFESSTPQIYLDIDRTKAQMLGINVADVFGALQTYLGSYYVNDFNLLGRTFRVTAQAEDSYRLDPKDVLQISQGQAIQTMQQLAAETLPDGFTYEWTTLALQQIRAGNSAVFAFVLAVLFVFLVLAAQYESLTLPLAVILIVPMSLIASITGVLLRGQDNNILTQVGFIVLIGLAAKNAILIVEFAKQLEDRGRDRWAAAVEAARLRLRPILMTSLAFIFGVVPLVWGRWLAALGRKATTGAATVPQPAE